MPPKKRTHSEASDKLESPRTRVAVVVCDDDSSDNSSNFDVANADDSDGDDDRSSTSSSGDDEEAWKTAGGGDVKDYTCHRCWLDKPCQEYYAAEIDLDHGHDVSAIRLCIDCSRCTICHKFLGSGCVGEREQFGIVIDGENYACAGLDDRANAVGCGELCAKCGVVPTETMPVHAPGVLQDDWYCDAHSHRCVRCTRKVGHKHGPARQLFAGGLACDYCAVSCNSCDQYHLKRPDDEDVAVQDLHALDVAERGMEERGVRQLGLFMLRETMQLKRLD